MINFIKLYKNQLILTLILIILTVSAYFVYQVNKDSTNYYTSVLLVEKDNIEYELKIRNSDKATIYRVDNDENIISRVPRVGKERLSLPNLSEIETKNTIEGKVALNELTFEITFSDSFKYVKYLIENGNYNIEMSASTPQFVEIFLVKEGEYKRLIVFRDKLMISDMFESAELPEVQTYFDRYSNIEENLEGENSYE